MKKTVLLIHPKTGYMDQERSNPAMPLNLIHAASLLQNDYELVLLDQRIEGKDFYKKLDDLLKKDLLFVGITCYSGPIISYALEICEHIRTLSQVSLIWGGIHPTILPRQTIENPLVDMLIDGEGEETMKELADTLSNNKNIAGIKGLWYKQNGEIIEPQKRESVDLNRLPFPPYYIVDTNRYLQRYGDKKFINYQLSRGCPKKCAYCFNLAFNKDNFRYKTIERAIKEIQELKKNVFFEGIFFVDDNLFCLPKDYLKRLAVEIKNLGLVWYIQGGDIVSLNRFSREEFQFFSANGLKRVTIGVETGSPRMREVINKEGTIETIKEVITKMKNIPINVWCCYINNLPTETIEDLQMSIDLIMDLKKINSNVHNSPFYKFTPFAGTPIYEKFAYMLKMPNSLAEWGQLSWEYLDSPVYVDHLKDPHFFKSLFLASLLCDKKLEEMGKNMIVKYLTMLYRPIANFRLKRLFFKLNIELFFFEKIFKVF